MRVIQATNEREVDCACGARLSYWPSDVTSSMRMTSTAVPDTGCGPVYVGDYVCSRFVKCPCCGQPAEVDGG